MQATPKRILLIGADGVIGLHVHGALSAKYEVIRAGLNGPDLTLDLADATSLTDKLAALGPLDAVISTAGHARFAPVDATAPADIDTSVYGLGLKDKLLGQVNLALAARRILRPDGSITLTSGTTRHDPILGGSSLSMVNGALDHWVQRRRRRFAPCASTRSARAWSKAHRQPPSQHFPALRWCRATRSLLLTCAVLKAD